MNAKEIVEFYQLVIASLEGDISDADYQQMMNRVENSPEMSYFYCELIKIHTNLCCPKLADSIFHAEDSEISRAYQNLINGQSDTWIALLDTEIHAPVSKEKKAEDPETGQGAVSKQIKFSLYAITLAASIMIVVSIFLQINGYRSGSHSSATLGVSTYKEVATLTDEINAVFEDKSITEISGYRFQTDTMPIRLLSGVAKVELDNGVQLILEGPAELRFFSDNKCYLGYGSLYAEVPESGHGFTVMSGGSRIVDLGTEFGVFSDISGNTELHVLKGKTIFSNSTAGDQGGFVEEGSARKLLKSSDKIVDIAFDKNKFIRRMSSTSNLVWRGESLSLASLVAGGDGFDIMTSESGIDPANGHINDKAIQEYERIGVSRYNMVHGNNYVDGVFIPCGQVQVSSAGDIFKGFPETDRYYWCDITSSDKVKMDVGRGQEIRMVSVELKDMTFRNASEDSLILVHSNAGITFDLEKIRARYPLLELVSFRAVCGIASNIEELGRSDFWVLIDGECVYSYSVNEMQYGLDDVNVRLNKTDKFLTLAVTDGSDKISYDWCLFADPFIDVRSE